MYKRVKTEEIKSLVSFVTEELPPPPPLPPQKIDCLLLCVCVSQFLAGRTRHSGRNNVLLCVILLCAICIFLSMISVCMVLLISYFVY